MAVFLIALSFHVTEAKVWIPDADRRGYFDSDNIYTVTGLLKNGENMTVVPILDIDVKSKDGIISISHQELPIPPYTDMPFKVKMPQVESGADLGNIEVDYIPVDAPKIEFAIMYDDSLVLHDDGHITGKIQNTGNRTIHQMTVYAAVRDDKFRFLDAGRSSVLSEFEPGQTRDFAIYPDPSVSGSASYYSCFGTNEPGVPYVLNMTATRDGKKIDIPYLAEATYSDPEFSNDGNTLTFSGINSYPFSVNANFMVPMASGDEKFDVRVDDKPVNFVQSRNTETRNWHILFRVPAHMQSEFTISGFNGEAKQDPDPVPGWLKTNAEWWITHKISNEDFTNGLDSLILSGVLKAPEDSSGHIQGQVPDWLRRDAKWFSSDKITGAEFVKSVQYLIDAEIIKT